MRYVIGRNGEGLFLLEGTTEGEMLANRALGAAYASLQMQSIREYLKREGDKANPVARVNYERIENDPHSLIGLDEFISSIDSLTGKKLPPSKISQGLIKRAYTGAVQRFESAGIRL